MKPVGSIFAAIWTAVVPMLAAAGGAFLLGACASCQSTVRQAPMPAIAAGTFDGVAADPGAQRLYLADGANNKVDVVDVSTANPRFMQAIDVGAVPHGLAVAPDTKVLYAGLTGGAVAVIDTRDGSPTFMKVVTRIKADPTEVDLLDYSAGTKRLFAATGSGGDVVAIDTTSNQVIRWYSLHVPVEQPRYNPVDGKLYVTTPGTSSLVQIDLADGMTSRNYFIKGCGPSGLAINPARQLAVTACKGSVAMVNLRTGAQEVTRSVPGGDLVTYDPSSDRFAVASPHGDKDSVVGVFDGDGTFIGSVAATPKAHAPAFIGLRAAPRVAQVRGWAVGLRPTSDGGCSIPLSVRAAASRARDGRRRRTVVLRSAAGRPGDGARADASVRGRRARPSAQSGDAARALAAAAFSSKTSLIAASPAVTMAAIIWPSPCAISGSAGSSHRNDRLTLVWPSPASLSRVVMCIVVGWSAMSVSSRSGSSDTTRMLTRLPPWWQWNSLPRSSPRAPATASTPSAKR